MIAACGVARGHAPGRRRAAGSTVAACTSVAAENFWGNIAAQIGGRDVQVTSLITNPNADPHLFETDAQDAALLAEAQVVIENGAGYDTWMGSLLGADGGQPRIVNAASVLHVTGSDPNPHLWYDLPRVPKVAAAIAAALTKASARGRVRPLPRTWPHSTRRSSHSMPRWPRSSSGFHNVAVAYTERVPGYLLAAADLDVKTPPGFARAIEDGTDPGAADTVAMRQLLTNHDINVLLYNVQTVTPVTTQMRSIGQAARHPGRRRVRDHAGGRQRPISSGRSRSWSTCSTRCEESRSP